MQYRQYLSTYSTVAKATITYLITVSSVLAIKSTGTWWSWFGDSEAVEDQASSELIPVIPAQAGIQGTKAYISNKLKRNSLEFDASLPLVEAIELGRFNVTGFIQDMVIQNNRAYLALGELGFQVVDLSDFTQAKTLINHKTYSFAHQLEVANNFIFVADGMAGLRIYDITNITNPNLAGVYLNNQNLTYTTIDKLAISQNKVFIASTQSEVDFIDVQEPQQVFKVCVNMPSLALSVFVSGNTLYAIDREEGLYTFDITNMTYPQVVGNVRLLPPSGVFVSNDLAFVVCGGYDDTLNLKPDVYIIDVKNSSRLQVLSNYSTVSAASDLEVRNNIGYTADGYGGLQVLNVTNPLQPRLLSSFSISGYSYGVTLAGTNAHIIGDSFTIIDISIVTAPRLLVNVEDVGGFDVAIVGTIAYIAGDSLLILNISDPESTNPNIRRLIASYTTQGTPFAITVLGNFAYLADNVAGVQVIDVSDPYTPNLVKSYPIAGVRKMQILNNIAYVAARRGGICIIDLNRNPQDYNRITFNEKNAIINLISHNNFILYTSPVLGFTLIDTNNFTIGSPFASDILGSALVTDSSLNGNKLYLASSNFGLIILDISNLNIPRVLGNYRPGNGWGVAVSGNIVCLVQDRGFLILDVSIPANVQLLANYSVLTGSNADTTIIISATRVYLARTNGNLDIIDISNPRSPLLLGSYAGPSRIRNLIASNTLVYVGFAADYFAKKSIGVHIVDVSMPSSPQLLGVVNVGDSSAINIVDNIAFITSYPLPGFLSGLFIVEITDAANPQKLGRFDIEDAALSAVITHGIISYVMDYYGELHLINIEDLTSPQVFKTFITSGPSYRIILFGDFAFVLGEFVNLQLLNVGKALNRYSTQYTASEIAANNNIVYVADTGKNLNILDITNFTNPRLMSHYSLSSHAIDLAVTGTYLYVAEGFEGIEVLDVSNVSKPIFAARIKSDLTNVRRLKVANDKLFAIDNDNSVVIFDIRTLDYLTGQLILQEGEQHIMTPQEVAVTGFNNIASSQLQINVENLLHGQFELIAIPNVSKTTFNLAEVEANQVIFVHDGSEFAPSFSLTFSDGNITKGPFTANIVYLSVNDPPILLNHFISINEGESISINATYLSATDVETNSQDLVFVITQQGYSQFERIRNPGVIITRFTQAEVIKGDILFRHINQQEDIDLKPYFLIAVEDGTIESEAIPAIIDYNAAPRFTQNQISIYRGQSLTLSSNELAATDRDDAAETLVFIINNIVHGTFNKNNFTQKEIVQGTIQFQHDNSIDAPSFDVSIQDKRMQTKAQSVRVTFSNKNSELAFDTVGISLTTAGGGVGLVLIGVGIFSYRSYSKNASSRKQHPYAAAIYNLLKPIDAANFNSAEGQRFVQGINQLKAELQNQNIDADRMGDWELTQLVEQTVLAIQTEITAHTNWRGESTMDGHDIQRYAARLAIAILKIRAGIYQAQTDIFSNSQHLDNVRVTQQELEMSQFTHASNNIRRY